MSRFVLALDQGTTSSRSILFDHAGAIVAVAQREFSQSFPQPGWVEHDANEIWQSQLATIDEVLARAGIAPTALAAVGITNQRETVVVWDRASAEPVAPAIVWQDRRTADRCDALRAAGNEARVRERTGLLLDPYFSGTKLSWLLDQVPGARARAQRGELCFGTVDSWLAFKLTGGEHVTDVSNASRTMLLNLRTAQWDEEMLDLIGVPLGCLPRILPSSFDAGLGARIRGHAVPLTGIAGDQQAALFGQACYQAGMAKNTYGTGCFMLMNTGTQPLRSANRLLTTIAWERDRQVHYAIEGSVFIGGAVVQWLRDGLGLITRSSDVEALAASVPDNGGVYFVPAFAGLGSPHWDARARGTLMGLTRGSTRGHIARAALESIAFQSAELLSAMQADAAQPLLELRVDGGATTNDLLIQFQADLLGVPVVRPRVTETTALGAAYLAGLAVGFWSSEAELAANWQVDRRFEPMMSRDQAVELMRRWSRAIERAKGWSED
jgi:glycerol kinase